MKKYLVSYNHPSNFYRTSHYPRTADRTRMTKVFNNEESAKAFAAEAAAHNATNITINTHD